MHNSRLHSKLIKIYLLYVVNYCICHSANRRYYNQGHLDKVDRKITIQPKKVGCEPISSSCYYSRSSDVITSEVSRALPRLFAL